MSAGGFADWLEAVQITPITPEKMRCVTEKNEVVRGENTPITPITPVTPQNAQGQTENTENAPAMQASAATPAPQWFPDPGPARLLALVQAFCTATHASDRERAQWMQDVEATPAHLRGDLFDYLRQQLPPARSAPMPAPPAPATPPPMPWTHIDQPWRQADRLYLAHHGQCPTCKAAATGHADRCTEGQHLHHQYMAALTTTN